MIKLILTIIFTLGISYGYSQVTESQLEIAKEIFHHFENHEFKKIPSYLDFSLKDMLSAEMIEMTWIELSNRLGGYKGLKEIKTDTSGGSNVVYITCIFKEKDIDLQVVFKNTNIVTGLWLVPSQKNIRYKIPTYAKLDSIEEQDIQVITGPYTLKGTITTPKEEGKYPVVILIHGTGAMDQDETIGPNKPFRDLALGLASNGIGVLRYEKRTKAFPKEMAKQFSSLTVKDETMDDVMSAIQVAKQNSKVDPSRIYLLGHSLGGMLAPRIAANSVNVSGIIIFAGNARPLEDILLYQIQFVYTLDGLTDDEERQLDSLKKYRENVKNPGLSVNTSSFKLPMGLPASYWLDLKTYDPVKTAKELKIKILILQGEKDYQVTFKDFEKWGQELSRKKNVKLKLYKDLNHLFMEGNGVPSDYETPSNIAEYVIHDIADWIKNE